MQSGNGPCLTDNSAPVVGRFILDVVTTCHVRPTLPWPSCRAPPEVHPCSAHPQHAPGILGRASTRLATIPPCLLLSCLPCHQQAQRRSAGARRCRLPLTSPHPNLHHLTSDTSSPGRLSQPRPPAVAGNPGRRDQPSSRCPFARSTRVGTQPGRQGLQLFCSPSSIATTKLSASRSTTYEPSTYTPPRAQASRPPPCSSDCKSTIHSRCEI